MAGGAAFGVGWGRFGQRLEVTVKNHLTSIFQKLGVATRAEAVALALRKHLLEA